jgi:hypothetical protein
MDLQRIGGVIMTLDEYKKYKNMTPKERFYYLNEGSLKDRIQRLADISEYEKQEDNACR